MNDNLLSALQAIPVSKTDYNQWLRVGMALKNEGYPCTVWDTWSQPDTRYRPDECRHKWNTFRSNVANPVRGGTVIDLARSFGWQPPETRMDLEAVFASADANPSVLPAHAASPVPPAPARQPQTAPSARIPSPASEETRPVNVMAGPVLPESAPAFSARPLPPPSGEKAVQPRASELIRYLRLLFRPTDIVGYVVHAAQDADGRWKVHSRGNYSRTAGDLIAALESHPADMGAAIGDWEPEAGAWIRFNPLDGKGVANANVTRFDYALVESDSMPVERQEQLYRELRLPIRVLVHSGGRSVHAIVRVDAANAAEYRTRVDFLYNWLEKHGVEVDRQNSNPSRLSRMPGVTRNGQLQRILDEDIGCRSWDDWLTEITEESGKLPPTRDLDYYDEHPPKPPEELIEGVLRRGHKLLLAGPSKAGKSFALMELSAAFATGGTWLGFHCKQCKVLYVNLEIDQDSGPARLLQIFDELGLDSAHKKNITIWNLRGHAMPMDQLTPLLIRKLKGKGYGAFIIDPIYKVITGDENNASEMGQFCNEFDKICMETGCAAIYCHHHSKGAQGAKKSMDRASGSGVFARDPDALLDIIELQLSKEDKSHLPRPFMTAWRMEGSLREFPPFEPVCFWFDYPLHRVDTKALADKPAEGAMGANLAMSPKRTSKEERLERLDEAFSVTNDGGISTVGEMADYIGKEEKTIRNYLKEFADRYAVRKGGVVCQVAQEEQ